VGNRNISPGLLSGKKDPYIPPKKRTRPQKRGGTTRVNGIPFNGTDFDDQRRVGQFGRSVKYGSTESDKGTWGLGPI